jgi:hypothetical protein
MRRNGLLFSVRHASHSLLPVHRAMQDFVDAQVMDLVLILLLSRASQHRHHFVGALYLGKNTLHGLEFGLMGVAVHLGNGIFD